MNFRTLFLVPAAIIVAVLCCSSCKKNEQPQGGLDNPPALVENPKIAVVADLHYFDLSLLKNNGSAFQAYISGDRKLIEESSAITASVVNSLLAERPDVVLVCGDMTKDGEKVSHEGVIAQLDKLRAAGIMVFVTPGNHDIANPASHSYDGDNTSLTPTVTPAEYKSLYRNYGFEGAIATGPDMCYVAEAAKDLWIISIDACEYQNNPAPGGGHSVTKGSLSAEKLAWVTDRTREGVAAGKTVFGLMHHGLIEHYDGQTAFFSEYVVADWQNVSAGLADAGMKAVFTGHYHAQDIRKSANTSAGKFIFDIETGSTVTAPCPYRIIEMKGNEMQITSRLIRSIDGFPAITDFQTHATGFLETGMAGVVTGMLTGLVGPEMAAMAGPLAVPVFTETFVAHYKGDEGELSTANTALFAQLKGAIANIPEQGAALSVMVDGMVTNIWDDPAPADNTVTIDLATGAVR